MESHSQTVRRSVPVVLWPSLNTLPQTWHSSKTLHLSARHRFAFLHNMRNHQLPGNRVTASYVELTTKGDGKLTKKFSLDSDLV